MHSSQLLMGCALSASACAHMPVLAQVAKGFCPRSIHADNDQSFIPTRPELFPPEEAPLGLQVKLVLADSSPVY